jgi:hypothetical protein
MHRTRRHVVAAAAIAAVASGAAGAPRTTPGPPPAPGGPLVTLSGNVDGLYPGAALTLPLTVTNTQPYDVRLTAVRVDIGAASAACPASSITVNSWQGGAIVPGRGTTQIQLPVAMPTGAADGCVGQTFPLTFVGDAQPAKV